MRLLVLILLLATPARAQLSMAPDLTPFLRAAELAAAIEATAPVCPAPLPDTITGGAGTQPACMPRPDATRPAIVQAKNTVTDAAAKWSVTWDRAFASAPLYVDARVYGTDAPYSCSVNTQTATGASGMCVALVSTTLPSDLTQLLRLTISPVVPAAAGVQVRVFGRQ